MKADLTVIDSMIYSKMKNHIMNKLGTKYNLTMDNFSAVNGSPTDASFPFVYFTKIYSVETGCDLESTNINADRCTYQINVYDNVEQERAKEVMDSVVEAFKLMAFKGSSLPTFAESNPTHVMIARFTRVISDGDEI